MHGSFNTACTKVLCLLVIGSVRSDVDPLFIEETKAYDVLAHNDGIEWSVARHE